jgi:hypothetical protein
MTTYAELNERSRYLKIIDTAGNAKALRDDEITRCEEYATSTIEGFLGKSWALADTPDKIRDIADMLGSSKAYYFLHTGQTPLQSEYAKNLKDDAMAELKLIKDGDMGLKLPDGSWDEDFPGPSKEENKGGTIRIIPV